MADVKLTHLRTSFNVLYCLVLIDTQVITTFSLMSVENIALFILYVTSIICRLITPPLMRSKKRD